MGGQSTMNNEPINPKPNRLKALALIEIGLFELGFVAIILLLFFGILNYFNILSVSDLFPHQLGWLPRREAPNGASHQKIRQSTVATPTPSGFNYDVKKGKLLLTQYLTDNLNKQFLQEKIDIKQGLSIDGRTENLQYQFGSYYEIDKNTISANFHFKESTNTSNDFIIFIQPPNLKAATATAELANNLTSLYFLKAYSPISNCSAKSTTSYCESFKTEESGKRGFGIVFANNGSKFTPIVFTCFIPKDSKYYLTQTSCITP